MPGYRYGFNGKEGDDEMKGGGNHLDFGARGLDSRTIRWWSVDPLFPKFPDWSDYSFVLNSPTQFVDLDGRDVYLVVYNSEESTFRSGAETRKNEIESSENFDPSKDVVFLVDGQNLNTFKQKVELLTREAEKRGFGKTVELSFYGHNGDDGPRGEVETNSIDPSLRKYGQLHLLEWSSVDYNFDPEKSLAAFYGCESDEFAYSFLNNVSDLRASAGTIETSYPSISQSKRELGLFNNPPVYWIAAKGTISDWGVTLRNGEEEGFKMRIYLSENDGQKFKFVKDIEKQAKWVLPEYSPIQEIQLYPNITPEKLFPSKSK